MGDSSKRGHNPDMSSINGDDGGKCKPYANADSYVKQPGNAYGKGPSGKQPFKARHQSYTPDDKVGKR